MSPPAFAMQAVDRVDYRLEPKTWEFARDEAAAIDAHWTRLRAAKPALFNGRVLMLHRSDLVAEAGATVLRGACLEVEFKAFIAWRDFGCPDPTVRNCFAMAALQSADGAFLLGRMGAQTANAGRVYFPSGTPDLSDIVDGHVDLEGSVRRELAEETGLRDVALDRAWTVVDAGPRLACMKRVRSHQTADALLRAFASFQAAEREPELAALESVFGPGDIDSDATLDFVQAYLRHVWAEAGSGQV